VKGGEGQEKGRGSGDEEKRREGRGRILRLLPVC